MRHTLCSDSYELRCIYPHIILNLVLPCCQADQTAKWSTIQKEKYIEIASLADNIEYTSKNYSDSCMKKRNSRLIELSDFCICYYNENRKISGTGQTVIMALQKNIPIINLYPNK